MSSQNSTIMPLSNDERARIIEIVALRAAVESTIGAAGKKSKLSGFSRQVILLLLGFLFTTGAGGVLTYYWKQREWHNQRSYLAQQRVLDKKYSVIDRTFNEVATTTAAADDVLWIYLSGNLSQKDVTERMNNWYKTSRNWRVQSKILNATLASTFRDQEIAETFKQIVDKRWELGNAIMNLPEFKPKWRVRQNWKRASTPRIN